MPMLIGCIADDFTGASDIANTLSVAGMRTLLVPGEPTGDPPPDAEGVVVALKTRSCPPGEAIAASRRVARWLTDHGCRQMVFKYCSTFDSTPSGNIGPVAEALAGLTGARGVVVCPSFPAAGRTLYQGHLFVHDRLLSESGMERHPINPMTDPDIRRWLACQTKGPVGHVPLASVRSGDAGSRLASATETLVVVDAITDEDLFAIGRAVADAPLVTGGSAIAAGLVANFRQGHALRNKGPLVARVSGPAAILAGSCSHATREQIAAHRRSHPARKIDVDALMADRLDTAAIADFMRRHGDEAPLVYSSAEPDEVAALQQRYGQEALARRLEGLFAALAKDVVSGGVRRLVVAGGETSGAAVSALGLASVWVGREIDTGVPILIRDGEQRLALALKSGNFGGGDFFIRALDAMEQAE